MTARSLSFLFAHSYDKEPKPLGVDMNLEIQNSFMANPFEGDDLDQHLWATLFSIRKGIYWNFSLNFSFLSPLNESIQNGFSAGLGHSMDYKWGFIRSSTYIFSYNIDELLNQRGAGLNSILYLKSYKFFTGLGFGLESLRSEAQGSVLRSDNNLNLLSYRALVSILIPIKSHRISLNASLGGSKNNLYTLSYGFRL